MTDILELLDQWRRLDGGAFLVTYRAGPTGRAATVTLHSDKYRPDGRYHGQGAGVAEAFDRALADYDRSAVKDAHQ